MKTLGQRLKAFRDIKKISAREIADQVGVSVSTYRDWENGRSIKGEPYTRLAEALGVHVLEIIEGRRPGDIYDDLLDIEKTLIRAKKKL
ncbi:MAG: hypothetical protein B7Y39_17215 [Bdellovibrio sp. 28-41-41]|nr:MAG: hypothetical protein B7Y39_17215 [Bdellovibrio sp. 28-41-41]